MKETIGGKVDSKKKKRRIAESQNNHVMSTWGWDGVKCALHAKLEPMSMWHWNVRMQVRENVTCEVCCSHIISCGRPCSLSKPSMYSKRTRSHLPLHFVTFVLGFVEIALHLFNQPSCFVFLSLLEQLPDHSSFFLFLFFVHDCSLKHFVQFRFSFHTFLTASVPRVCLFFHIALRPSPQRSLSTFPWGWDFSTNRVSSGRRPPRLVVATGILFFRTILCSAIFRTSRSSQRLLTHGAPFFPRVHAIKCDVWNVLFTPPFGCSRLPVWRTDWPCLRPRDWFFFMWEGSVGQSALLFIRGSAECTSLRTDPHGRWRWRWRSGEWKRKMRKRRWRVQSGESKRGQNKHCAWSMDDMMRTTILSQCHVRHWNECGETLENVTYEGVLFTPPVGCSRLLSTVNDLTTTFFF